MLSMGATLPIFDSLSMVASSSSVPLVYTMKYESLFSSQMSRRSGYTKGSPPRMVKR